MKFINKGEEPRFVNLFVDHAFKRVFGRTVDKSLLIHFLNCILDGQHKITDLEHRPTVHMGEEIEDRSVVFDLLCETSNGDQILIELQNCRQDYFADRELFYSTFPVQSQAQKGVWNYRLLPEGGKM